MSLPPSTDVPSRTTWTHAAHPLWRWILAFCAGANVVVLWCGAHLPFTDLPQHAAMIATLRHWWDPAWRFQEHFALDLGRTQYLLYYAVGAILAVPFGSAERANVVLLSAVAIGLPYSLRSLVRSVGGDERVAVAGCPLFWNQSLLFGFFNYLAALPVLLGALALTVRQAEGPTRLRAVGLALLCVALYYLHLSALAFFVVAALLVTVLLPRPAGTSSAAREIIARLPNLWRRLLWLSPVGLLFLAWLATSPVANPRSVGWSEQIKVEYLGIRVTIAHVSETLIDIWHARLDEYCLVALAVAGGALVLAGFAARDRDPNAWRRGTMAVLAGTAVACYFAVPYAVGWLFLLNERYSVVAALLLPAALRVRPGWRGFVPLGLATTVAVVIACNAAAQIRRFDVETGGFDEVLATTQPARRLLYLPLAGESEVARFVAFHHFGAYYRARYGGVAEYSFADLPQSPVRYRAEAAPPVKPQGWEWKPSFRPEVDDAYYDYVLVRGDFEPASPRWRCAARSGAWALFDKMPAPP